MANAEEPKVRLDSNGPPPQEFPAKPPNIPDHRLIRCIGQGSYGEVWLAQNAVGTCRAVKIVRRARFEDDKPYEREFIGIQKYEPISRSNEGLIDVLQLGRNDAEGYFYYIMELADDATTGHEDEARERGSYEGYVPKTLAGEIRARGHLPVEECITLGLTLNLALGNLHRHGLIHRDVKPSNIIFVNGVPKLADIGLVTEVTEARSFVGTEGFIPPEGPNSSQADLYALGKVLYEASMGKDRQEFPEPYTRLGTEGESKALMELNAIVLKACARDPKKRYESAEEMNADLALLHSGKSVQQKHRVERRLVLMTRLGAVTTAVIVLSAFPYYWAITEARHARAAAKKEMEQRIQAQANQQKAEEVTRFLQSMLAKVQPSVARGRDTALLREILDQTAQHITKDLNGQPEVQAEIWNTLGQVYWDLGEHYKAEAMFREVLKLTNSTWGEKHGQVATALMNLGGLLLRLGRPDETELLEGRALALNEELNGCANAETAGILTLLGRAEWDLGRAAEAEVTFRKVVNLWQKLKGDDSPEVMLAQGNVGIALEGQGRYAEAEPLVRKAVEAYGTNAPLWESHALGRVLLREGKLIEAEAVVRRALAASEEWWGSDVKYLVRLLAGVLQAQGRLDEAEPVARKVEEFYMSQAKSGELDRLNQHAWFLATCGHPAVRDGPRAIPIAENIVAATFRTNADCLDTLAAAYAAAGEFQKAVNVQREALTVLAKSWEKQKFTDRLKLYESNSIYCEDWAWH